MRIGTLQAGSSEKTLAERPGNVILARRPLPESSRGLRSPRRFATALDADGSLGFGRRQASGGRRAGPVDKIGVISRNRIRQVRNVWTAVTESDGVTALRPTSFSQ